MTDDLERLDNMMAVGSRLDIRGSGPAAWGKPVRYYFNPIKNQYYLTFPDNQGRETVVDYDPYTKDSDNYK